MTELRDARLKKALEHAPDEAGLPPASVREAIRAHAALHAQPGPNTAQPTEPKPPSFWRWLIFGGGKGSAMPWNAALATVLLAGFVTLVLHYEQAEGPPELRTSAPAEKPVAASPLPGKLAPGDPRVDAVAQPVPKGAAKQEAAIAAAAPITTVPGQSAAPPPTRAVAVPADNTPLAAADLKAAARAADAAHAKSAAAPLNTELAGVQPLPVPSPPAAPQPAPAMASTTTPAPTQAPTPAPAPVAPPALSRAMAAQSAKPQAVFVPDVPVVRPPAAIAAAPAAMLAPVAEARHEPAGDLNKLRGALAAADSASASAGAGALVSGMAQRAARNPEASTRERVAVASTLGGAPPVVPLSNWDAVRVQQGGKVWVISRDQAQELAALLARLSMRLDARATPADPVDYQVQLLQAGNPVATLSLRDDRLHIGSATTAALGMSAQANDREQVARLRAVLQRLVQGRDPQ